MLTVSEVKPGQLYLNRTNQQLQRVKTRMNNVANFVRNNLGGEKSSKVNQVFLPPLPLLVFFFSCLRFLFRPLNVSVRTDKRNQTGFWLKSFIQVEKLSWRSQTHPEVSSVRAFQRGMLDLVPEPTGGAVTPLTQAGCYQDNTGTSPTRLLGYFGFSTLNTETR